MTKKITSIIGDHLGQAKILTDDESLLDFMESEEIKTKHLEDYEEFNEESILDNADKLSESGLLDKMIDTSQKPKKG